jgi:peptidoglycan/LPS O-acetylase OafA/YrhL
MYRHNDYLNSMVKQEYYILNLLRGLSALFVLFYHFFVFFFAHQSTSAGLLLVEPVDLPDPFYLQAIMDFPLNIGHFGVTFFFLISGFLIQPSLERYVSFKDFVVHKILRLWPSYVICFAMGLLFVWVFYLIGDSPFPYTWDHVCSYFFWVRDISHHRMIDGSVWSLEIQIKFYLLAGIIWSMAKKNFLEKICLIIVLMSFAVYGLHSFLNGEELSWFYLVSLARKNLQYFMLILLGACIYSFYKKQISWQKALGLCGMLLACFVSPLFHSPDLIKTISYLLGFFTFSYVVLFHATNIQMKGMIGKFINWVSDISYPIYIGHVIPGYVMMYLMIENGLSVYLGIFISLIYVFVMAEFVHKKIEVSFVKMGGKLFSFFEEKAPVRKEVI